MDLSARKRASMIPRALSAAPGISRGVTRLCGVLAFALVAACAADEETTIARLARQRELGGAEARRVEHHRELARLEQESEATAAAIAAVKAESVQRAAQVRAARAELQLQVARLATAEHDLADARARTAVIEAELRPLRDLEGALRDQERLRDEASQRLGRLRDEVAAAAADDAKKEGELRPQLEELRRRLAAAQEITGALVSANEVVARALAVLQPPAPSPATPPAPAAQQKK